MVELKEKANGYAEENVINVLKETLAKVYADGYREGYKDREEEIPVDLRNNQTEYVDLGLPSGTLWSIDYERDGDETLFLPRCKAVELNIPTNEQWKELMNTCKWTVENREVICIGLNGNIIRFLKTGYIKGIDEIIESSKALFWVKNDNDNWGATVFYNGEIYKNTYNYYGGYKLPVRLIKPQLK